MFKNMREFENEIHVASLDYCEYTGLYFIHIYNKNIKKGHTFNPDKKKEKIEKEFYQIVKVVMGVKNGLCDSKCNGV